MKQFQILGITMEDYSVREAMRKVEGFLHDGKVSTICYVTATGIMEAEGHEETRAFLENMNLMVAADCEVLKAADIQHKGHMREVENNEFMRQFLHRISRSSLGVCLLAGDKEQLEKLRGGLLSYQSSLNILGEFVLEEGIDEDNLINDINVLAPVVLISSLDHPVRESFFAQHHMKLHAEIWLILKSDVVIENRRLSLSERISRFLTRKAFKRSLDQYKQEEEKKTEQILKVDTREIDTEAVRAAEAGLPDEEDKTEL